jgi:hypothetical protein
MGAAHFLWARRRWGGLTAGSAGHGRRSTMWHTSRGGHAVGGGPVRRGPLLVQLLGPGMNNGVLYLIHIFQANLNLQWFKTQLSVLKKFQTKYGFVENKIRNNFPYWNFSKFASEFKLKFKEALGFEIQ